MIEREVKEARPGHADHIVITEAPVTVLTEDGGPRKYPAGTMFGIHEGTYRTKNGQFANVSVHLHRDEEDGFLGEMESSLRRKVMKAEIRQWWMRSVAAGASVGVSVELARRTIECLLRLVS